MLLATNIGGLANRIRCIASCYKYTKDKPFDFRVRWDVLDDYRKHAHILNCPFNKLFKNNIEYEGGKVSHFYKSHCLLIEDFDGIPDEFNTFDSRCSKKFTKNDSRGRNIDFMYNKIPLDIRKKYIEAFQFLEPIDELQKQIDEFSSKHFDKDTVSVHIRSWNRNSEEGRRGYLYSIEKFENEMRKLDDKKKFYISTDSSYVINYFNSSVEWSKRVIFFNRKTDLDTSRDFPEGVQEDLIELYLLSKNNVLIGSHFSTFSAAAWWLGACTKDVTIL